MTYATRVNKISKPDGAVFMIKVRVSPDYEGGENDRTVSANTLEGAAIEALDWEINLLQIWDILTPCLVGVESELTVGADLECPVSSLSSTRSQGVAGVIHILAHLNHGVEYIARCLAGAYSAVYHVYLPRERRTTLLMTMVSGSLSHQAVR